MQIALHDHVLHARHGLIKKIGVRGVREVNVSLFARIAHQVLEFPREELLACFNVPVVTGEVWEVLANGCLAGLYLLAEEVHFVEEEDEGGLFEILAVSDALEKHERLVHLVLEYVSLNLLPIEFARSYSIAIFNKCVVVAANGDKEEDDLDVIKDVNPLLPL